MRASCLRHCCGDRCDRPGRASGVRAGQPHRATFWKTVQATCDATAAKPPSELGRRIAQTAIDEFTRFGGHQIDSDGRLFRFGLTEAEHEEDDGGNPQVPLGHLGWWQVMKYWRALFGDDPTDKLEVRGYRDASTSTQDTQEAALLRTSAAQLLRLAEGVSDPEMREILRETALRAADHRYLVVGSLHQLRDTAVGRRAERVPVRQRPSRLYLRRFRGERGRAEKRGQRRDLSRVSAHHNQTSRGRFDLRAARARARRRQRRGGARAHPGGARRQRRRALGPAHPLRGGRACRCAGAQGVHHRRQRQSGRHRQEAEPAPRPEILGLRKRVIAAAQAIGPCPSPRATRRAHRARQKCSLNDKKWFVLLQLR